MKQALRRLICLPAPRLLKISTHWFILIFLNFKNNKSDYLFKIKPISEGINGKQYKRKSNRDNRCQQRV